MIYLFVYLVGSIPFGYLLAKVIKGKNIKQEGSGNIGATNVSRVLGKKFGILTFVLDAGKGLLAIFIAKKFGVNLYIASYIVILGHIFPIWLGFRGGKGVATTIAILLYFSPIITCIALICWLVVFYFSKFSSLSAIVFSLIVPIMSLLAKNSSGLTYFICLLSLTMLLTHVKNILRLLNGTELKFSKKGQNESKKSI